MRLPNENKISTENITIPSHQNSRSFPVKICQTNKIRDKNATALLGFVVFLLLNFLFFRCLQMKIKRRNKRILLHIQQTYINKSKQKMASVFN